MNDLILAAIDRGVAAESSGDVMSVPYRNVAKRQDATGLAECRWHLRRIDFVLRGFAVRKFERLWIEIQIAMGGSQDGAHQRTSGSVDWSSDVHALRLVALKLRGVTCDVKDVAAVKTAYDSAQPPVRNVRTFPMVTIAAALVLTSGVTVASLLVSKDWKASSVAYTRPRPAPSSTAFQTGGTPLVDEALGKLLATEFLNMVIATDRAIVAADTKALVVALHRESLAHWFAGRKLTAPYSGFLAAYRKWAEVAMSNRSPDGTAPMTGPDVVDSIEQLERSTRKLSEAIMALGLGYYLAPDCWYDDAGSRCVLYSYRVENVSIITGAQVPGRVLDIRRIDNLNFHETGLGASDAVGDTVVMLDNVETKVSGHILEALADQGMFRVGHWNWREKSESARGIMLGAGTAIREELLAALGADAPAAANIANLVSERRGLLRSIETELRVGDVRLTIPTSLFLPLDYLSRLSDYNTAKIPRLKQIEKELVQLNAARIATKLEDIVIANTRNHEAQHLLDASYGLGISPEIEAVTGGIEDTDGKENKYATRVIDEVSANLSELSRSQGATRLVLWTMIDPVFWQRKSVGQDTGLVVLSALLRELGIPEYDVGRDNSVNMEVLAAQVRALCGKPSADIANAAGRVWARFFGRELTTFAISGQ